METVVEAVADGFVAFDAELRFTYVNQRAAEMWGEPAESFLGRTPLEVWADLDMEHSPFVLLFRRLLETRKTETLEAYAPTLKRWIETRGYPSSDGGIVVFFQDVSERRRAQDAAVLLAEASRILASSSDYEETLSNVARAMVPRLGDWAAVDLLDDPNSGAWPPVMQRVAIVHGDPAKLALTYESTTGYKKAEPYDVPDNKQWHTATWKIDDAQFVSQWAYNFTLNSGKYSIQSVTVKRLDK